MRRRVAILLVIALGAAAAIAGPALTQGDAARPNLVVVAGPEGPDFEVAGGRFRLPVTVANDGDGRARGSTTGVFLSPDAQRGGGDDIRLRGARPAPALGPGRQLTRRNTLRIPASVPSGVYFLIVCADVGDAIRETRNGDNCSVGGQRVAIDATTTVPARPEAGPPGPQGERGPTGDRGPAGVDVLRRLPPTTIDLSQPDDEKRDVVTAGPLTIRIECHNDDGTNPPDRARVLAVTSDGRMSTRFESEVPAGTETELQGGSASPPSIERVLISLEGGQEYVWVGMVGISLFGDGTLADDGDDPCFFAGALMEPSS